MPLAYHIDPQTGLVTVTGESAPAADWRHLLEDLRRDAAFRPGLALLRDLRSATRHIDSQAVMALLGVVREMWNVLGLRRLAMLTPRGQDDKAVMLEALAQDEGIPLRTFTFLDEARAWLAEQ